ncbi:hypothetical protein F4802DRAFT_544697 [Xylaria palmicola]|nr:hypothetical protein F4802DRAFT_544697 [Xylaria palmicola]
MISGRGSRGVSYSPGIGFELQRHNHSAGESSIKDGYVEHTLFSDSQGYRFLKPTMNYATTYGKPILTWLERLVTGVRRTLCPSLVKIRLSSLTGAAVSLYKVALCWNSLLTIRVKSGLTWATLLDLQTYYLHLHPWSLLCDLSLRPYMTDTRSPQQKMMLNGSSLFFFFFGVMMLAGCQA